MNYAITGANDQPLIIDKLKSAGIEVIQSSRGLICKTALSSEKLKALIDIKACVIEPIQDISAESPDVQKFLGSS